MMLSMRSATLETREAIKELAKKELEFRIENKLYLSSIDDWMCDSTKEIDDFRKKFFEECQVMSYFEFYNIYIDIIDESIIEILKMMIKTNQE